MWTENDDKIRSYKNMDMEVVIQTNMFKLISKLYF